jgi:hypothetical protein
LGECKEADEVEDLAKQIDSLVRAHPAYSICFATTTNCTDHLKLQAAFMKLRRK